jgi:hypothetical protein
METLSRIPILDPIGFIANKVPTDIYPEIFDNRFAGL